jgi:hypothetical protein
MWKCNGLVFETKLAMISKSRGMNIARSNERWQDMELIGLNWISQRFHGQDLTNLESDHDDDPVTARYSITLIIIKGEFRTLKAKMASGHVKKWRGWHASSHRIEFRIEFDLVRSHQPGLAKISQQDFSLSGGVSIWNQRGVRCGNFPGVRRHWHQKNCS